MTQQFIKIVIFSTHEEKRKNKLAPMGYGYILIRADRISRHYGCAFERSTEATLGHGLLRGIHQACLEAPDARPHAIIRNLGTVSYLEFGAKWIIDQAKGRNISKKDNAPLWQETALAGAVTALKMREPDDESESQQLEQAEAIAAAAKGLSLRRFAALSENEIAAGVWCTDESPGASTVEELLARYV